VEVILAGRWGLGGRSWVRKWQRILRPSDGHVATPDKSWEPYRVLVRAEKRGGFQGVHGSAGNNGTSEWTTRRVPSMALPMFTMQPDSEFVVGGQTENQTRSQKGARRSGTTKQDGESDSFTWRLAQATMEALMGTT